ncbi:MAG: hypothetical protein U9N19_02755 [Thermodesulfobacteriota bacterium]|nr:hypothetical protein [Thermodesulfobacteriota bacterium]
MARKALAEEMVSVLKSGGMIFIYDYRISDPRNPDTVGIRKSEIKRLFPGLSIKHRSHPGPSYFAPGGTGFTVAGAWVGGVVSFFKDACDLFVGAQSGKRRSQRTEDGLRRTEDSESEDSLRPIGAYAPVGGHPG